MHTGTHIHIHAHVYTGIHTYTYMHTYTQAYTHTHAHIYTGTHTYTHAYIYIHTQSIWAHPYTPGDTPAKQNVFQLISDSVRLVHEKKNQHRNSF